MARNIVSNFRSRTTSAFGELPGGGADSEEVASLVTERLPGGKTETDGLEDLRLFREKAPGGSQGLGDGEAGLDLTLRSGSWTDGVLFF